MRRDTIWIGLKPKVLSLLTKIPMLPQKQPARIISNGPILLTLFPNLFHFLINRFSVSGVSALTYRSAVICKSYFSRSAAMVSIIGEA